MSRQKRWSAIHYNAIAKDIRELFPLSTELDDENERITKVCGRGFLTALAINFARRFYQDYLDADEGLEFDPVKWLNQCSPDPEIYPIGELWEGSERA